MGQVATRDMHPRRNPTRRLGRPAAQADAEVSLNTALISPGPLLRLIIEYLSSEDRSCLFAASSSLAAAVADQIRPGLDFDLFYAPGCPHQYTKAIVTAEQLSKEYSMHMVTHDADSCKALLDEACELLDAPKQLAKAVSLTFQRIQEYPGQPPCTSFVPIPGLLETCPNLRELALCNVDLAEMDTPAASCQLQSLKLEDVVCCDEVTSQQVEDGFKALPSLTSLSLKDAAHHGIDYTSGAVRNMHSHDLLKHWPTICKALCSQLQHLELCVYDARCCMFSSRTPAFPHLKHLSTDIQFSEADAHQLEAVLVAAPALTHLTVGILALPVLAQLPANQLQQLTCRCLAACTHSDIQGKPDEELEQISAAVAASKAVGGVRLTSQKCFAATVTYKDRTTRPEALKVLADSTQVAVTELWLQDTHVTADYATAVAQHFPSCTSIKLFNCGVDVGVLPRFPQLLPELHTLDVHCPELEMSELKEVCGCVTRPLHLILGTVIERELQQELEAFVASLDHKHVQLKFPSDNDYR